MRYDAKPSLYGQAVLVFHFLDQERFQMRIFLRMTEVRTIATSKCVWLTAVLLIGCSPSPVTTEQASPEKTGDEYVSSPEVLQPAVITELSETQHQQQKLAMAAKDELFKRLSGRLMDVLEKDGAAAAIEVCRVDAVAFSEQVGHELGVEIGRTSFKLRSGSNPPPDWSRTFVEERVAEPRFVSLPKNGLGVFLPIKLQKKCEQCHGPDDQIAPDVKAALKLHYPNDQATGFKDGDLRGWFWVEVPQQGTDL